MRLIFLHGLGQGPSAWADVRSALSDRITAECPNLFSMARGERLDFPSLYRGFSDYCAEQGERLHLCGLSLGAVLALHFALEHPGAVGSLVLIAGRARMPGKLLQVQSALFHLMGEKSFQGMGISKADAIALTASMRKLDFQDALGDVRCPTLVLCGESDSANRREASSLAAGIPGAELAFLPGAGHEVNREAPAALAAALESFYRAGEPGENFAK